MAKALQKQCVVFFYFLKHSFFQFSTEIHTNPLAPVHLWKKCSPKLKITIILLHFICREHRQNCFLRSGNKFANNFFFFVDSDNRCRVQTPTSPATNIAKIICLKTMECSDDECLTLMTNEVLKLQSDF